MSSGVNRGVLVAHARGIVTSASVMVNTPAAKAAVSSAIRDTPALGMGLHLTLTHGQPVADPATIASLVDDRGRFRSAAHWMASPEEFDPAEIRHEITAQFGRFGELARVLPDHLDSHHFMTFFNAAAFAVMLDLAEEHGIPVRNPDAFLDERRIAEFCADIRAQNGGRGPRPQDVACLPARLRQLSEDHPDVGRPAAFDRRFYGDGATIERLVASLDALGPGLTEMMCHPGFATEPLDEYREQRERELAVLTDHRVRTALRRNHISLASYREWR